jgi:hypothetical protein
MKKQIIILVMALFVCNISIAQTKSEKRQLKKEQKLKKANTDYEKAKILVETKNFVFDANWVMPLGGKRRDISNDSHRLLITKNNAEGNLPYFGVVRMGGMNNSVGIEFNNEMTDYEVEFNDKKQKISISFEVVNKAERLKVEIRVYGGGANVVVSSSKRDTISYDGTITAMQE